MYEGEKLDEAEYFLHQMDSNKEDHRAFKYNLSAFLSASRSVLQFACKESQNKAGGQAWYDTSVASRPITEFFKSKRDMSIHEQPISPTKELRILIEEAMHQDSFLSVTRDHPQEYLTTVGQPDQIDWPPVPSNVTTSEAFTFDSNASGDIDTLCDFYLNELRSIVADGQSKGFLTP
jgi:hypothetical protein